MIKKHLIVGKQVYLQSKKPESHYEVGRVVELLIPLEDFWNVRGLLKMSNYLQASSEPQGEVLASMRKVFKICARWSVLEKDREWLNGLAGD